MRIVLLLLLWVGLPGPSAAWQLRQQQELTAGSAALRVVVKSVSEPRELRMHIIWPEPARTRLLVLDNPGNQQRLNRLLSERGCLAGVNGGYFHPDTTPLGLVVSEGRRLNPLERRRLLSGVLVVRNGLPTLLRVAEFLPSSNLSEALQAGPFLIDRGRPVRGLDNTKQARRTVILADRSGRYGLAVVESPVTLAELAAALAAPGTVQEIRVTRALNLDGGSSSALWVRTSDGEMYVPEGKRVRNLLCVRAAP